MIKNQFFTKISVSYAVFGAAQLLYVWQPVVSFEVYSHHNVGIVLASLAWTTLVFGFAYGAWNTLWRWAPLNLVGCSGRNNWGTSDALPHYVLLVRDSRVYLYNTRTHCTILRYDDRGVWKKPRPYVCSRFKPELHQMHAVPKYFPRVVSN